MSGRLCWRLTAAAVGRNYLVMSDPLEPVPSPEAQQLVTRVQREPGKSVASAFVLGLILSIFPVGRIISFAVGIALTLARPLLVVLGGLKLWEEVGRRRK
jgi:hypothetical protein